MKLYALVFYFIFTVLTPSALGGVVPAQETGFILSTCVIPLETTCVPAPFQQLLPTMNSHYWSVKNAYLKLQRLKLKKQFLDRCRERKVLPQGLAVRFNLAFGTDDAFLCESISKVLDETSSRILDLVYKKTVCAVAEQETCLQSTRTEVACELGIHRTNEMMGAIRKRVQKDIDIEKNKHAKKLAKLDKCHSSKKPVIKGGSTRLCASAYVRHYPNSPPERQVRQHRMQRGRGKKKDRYAKKDRKTYVPSEDDLKSYDPIVLADNVRLTEDQISICRLPDGFAPTPKTPIDVSDQVVGTHAWAERLRWHRHFQIEEEEKGHPVEKDFIKHPWYRPTTRPAPRKDPALEAFIQACTNDFLAIENRRKIKDNLSKGQRKALSELRALPKTHGAACRYADKAGTTVITSLKNDDSTIVNELTNPNFYDVLQNNPVSSINKKIKSWSKKWLDRGKINEDIACFVNDLGNKKPGKCKPLIKTHKPQPYPTRLLLSGCGTPVENLSKFVQAAISHLHEHLTYQVIDTKSFLKKVMEINDAMPPLPQEATLAVCDVVALYPNVNNDMGLPAIENSLTKHPPSTVDTSKKCVLEALDICLSNNVCAYTDEQNKTIYASPNHGTAMGPAHACEYVDVYMGELDTKLVETSPVPLISSLVPAETREAHKYLDFSRFRDDGFTILLNNDHVDAFTKHLESLNPPNIRWTVSHGKEVTYLDVKLKISNGKILTDVFSKHNHAYIPPNSCHPPSVFKGLISSVGTRLRMICSEDKDLRSRIEEYSKYFAMSGWEYEKAKRELHKGANKNRKSLLTKTKQKEDKKIAWVTTYDPRYPSKSELIRKYLPILYSNPKNKEIFQKNQIISADRRRKNLGEIYKPTIPNTQIPSSHDLEPGYFTCDAKRCDTCSHGENIKEFRSPWDGRKWRIRKHLNCTTKNVIYLVRCKIHPDQLYVGSTKNLKFRWANHKSDTKLKKTTKCNVSWHVCKESHPESENLDFLQIFAIDSVSDEKKLLQKETFWMCNLGTIFTGLNDRQDLTQLRIKYK